METTNNNRRKHSRFPVALAVEIKGDDDRNWLGVTRDVSRSGAMLLTSADLQLGKGIDLKVVVDEYETARWHTAYVRRKEPREVSSIWANEVAIEFDHEFPDNVEFYLGSHH